MRAMRASLALLRLVAICVCQPAAHTHRQLPPELPSGRQARPRLQSWGAAVRDPDDIFEEVDDVAEMSLLQSKTQFAGPALKPKALSNLFVGVSKSDCEEWMSLGSRQFSRRRLLPLAAPELASDFCVRALGRAAEVDPKSLDCDLAAGALAKGEKLVYFIRHAEGWHNLLQDWELRDPSLTPRGEQQARDLVTHPGLARAVSGNSSQRAQLIMVSPLRRALATAVLALNASLPAGEVPWHVDPDIAEASDLPCDTPKEENGMEALRKLRRPDLLPEYREVPAACFEKTGRYQYTAAAVRARFRGFTERLLRTEARRVIVMAHSGLLRLVLSNENEPGPTFALAEVRPYALSREGSYRPLVCGG